MRIWELRGGACVHIQEGAFMPPRVPAAPTALAEATGSSAGAASVAALPGRVTRTMPISNPAAAPAAPGSHEVGLGEEAREFIMQQLPLFQVRLNQQLLASPCITHSQAAANPTLMLHNALHKHSLDMFSCLSGSCQVFLLHTKPVAAHCRLQPPLKPLNCTHIHPHCAGALVPGASA